MLLKERNNVACFVSGLIRKLQMTNRLSVILPFLPVICSASETDTLIDFHRNVLNEEKNRIVTKGKPTAEILHFVQNDRGNLNMKTILLFFTAIAFIALITLYFTGSVSGKPADVVVVEDICPSTDNIRLVFAGDVMGHSTQINGAWRDGGDSCYNFIPTFQWIKNYISSADIAIANLEVTLAGEPYTGYPAFSSPVALAEALQDAGFYLLLTANNHIMDRGVKGMERTIQVLDSLGITHTGSFKDSVRWRSSYPLIINKNGFRLAFLNYTYGSNMSTARPPNIVNYIDTLRIAADLAKARELNADYIIACLHWGEEYQNKENATQRQIADFLARHGCNLIVGAHPHAIQPVKFLKPSVTDSALVAYSLGNLISNQRWRYSDGGIMLEVSLSKTKGIVSLNSWRYEPFWVRRYPDKGVQVYRIIPVLDYLSNPERFPPMSAEDEKLLIQFHNDTKRIINY